ncbi:MAG TPA: type IV pilus twitching motility protein PilT [Pseudolysinimonas sp.]|jgi:twitching motility protein PilT
MSANKPVWEIPISSDDEIARLAAAAAAGTPPATPAPAAPQAPAYELPVDAGGAAAPRASHESWPAPGQPPVPPAQASVPVAAAPPAPPIVEVAAVASVVQPDAMAVPLVAPVEPEAPPVFPPVATVPQPGSTTPAPVVDATELGPLSPEFQNVDPDIIAALQQVLFTGASDLHITANAAPMLRVDGGLSPVAGASVWGADKVRGALVSLLSPDQLARFEEHLELDLAYTLSASARFRVNMYQQRGAIGAAFRLIPTTIKTLEQLGVPDSVARFATLPRGLVLVTGPTGSGKSTTLAALIDLVNRTRADHIVTVEDPIEFMHGNKRSLVNQREVGHDTHSFAAALKHVLRQDPDVILVGEMRDLETISVALTAAETGHLVFATLHTQSAASTIDRVIDVYPPHQQDQVRTQLSATLQGVVSQTLVKKAQGNGRVVATEVLVTTPAIANLVREGKSYQITSSMQAGRELGMHTMDQHLAELVDEGKITRDSAFEKAHDPETLTRLIQRSAPTQQAITFNDEAAYASAEKGRR